MDKNIPIHSIRLGDKNFDWEKASNISEEMWEHRPMMAAAMADPGFCRCPKCGQMCWNESNLLKCLSCDYEFKP